MMSLLIAAAVMVAVASPALAQSCEDQRDMYRTLIEQLRGQRAVTEVDTAQALMEARREAARLRFELDKVKKSEAPKTPEAPTVERP